MAEVRPTNEKVLSMRACRSHRTCRSHTYLQNDKMMTSVCLNSGQPMPLVGLGTFKIKGKALIYRVLDAAFAAGYRSIDTAAVYKNEADIGTSLKELLPKYGLQRADIFLTSKLGPKDQGTEKCRAACLQSIQNLQCDYLDLYLIHWPGTQGMQPGDSRHSNLRLQSWHEMEALQKEGKVKAIGVSNFLQGHLDDLINHSSTIPAVLQIEYHPHLVQRNLVEYCKQKGIHFQAYSSLGTSATENKLQNDPVICSISKERNISVSQILLRWAVQQTIGVIPKSSNPEHIKDNIDVFSFSLTEEEMKAINGLDKQHHYCWNPSAVT